jgi:hypothetical protein
MTTADPRPDTLLERADELVSIEEAAAGFRFGKRPTDRDRGPAGIGKTAFLAAAPPTTSGSAPRSATSAGTA